MTVHQSNFIHNSSRVDQMWPMGQSLPIFTSAKSNIAHVLDFQWQPCSEYKSQKRLFDITGSVSFLYMLHLNSKRRELRKSRDWWFDHKEDMDRSILWLAFKCGIQLRVSVPLECTNFEMAQLLSGYFFFYFSGCFSKSGWMVERNNPRVTYLITKLTLSWIIRSTCSRATSRHRAKTLATL